MANGGIIGPVNTVNSTAVCAKTTSFTASGTFTARATASVDYLVIAGGGGGSPSSNGSNKNGGGGGGAGGYRASGCFTPSPTRGSAVPVIGSTGYTITVGGGGPGAGGSGQAACRSGVNSVFNYNGSTITSTGGGGGASDEGSCAGATGGSGGGGGGP